MRKKIVTLFILMFASSLVCSESLIVDKNNTSVSDKELRIVIEEAPVEAQKRLLANPKKANKIAWDLYKIKALSKKAQSLGIGQSESAQNKLKRMIDDFYAKLLLDEYIANQLPDIERLAKREYQVNKGQYNVDEMVDISHIQIKTECRSDDEAKSLAEEIIKKINSGKDFDELVLTESEDKGKEENKGYLGQFKKGEMVAEFEGPAFAMNKPGEISDVIKYNDSYFIVRLNKKIPKKQKTFSEAKEDIILKLRSKILESKRNEYIVDLLEENEASLDQQRIEIFLKNKQKEFVAQ